nr:hypothetical protein [Acidobacteriota bacterium]
AGVVGRVILSSPRAARVQMLIDRNAAAGAMIERTRAQGLVVGQGATLRMDYVSGTAEIEQGDLIVTSGIDKIYPKGFVIGTVEAIDRGTGTYHAITVRPSVDFSRLEEVLVVTTPPLATTAADIAVEATAIAAKQLQQEMARNVSPANATPRSPPPARTRVPASTGSPTNGTPRGPGE